MRNPISSDKVNGTSCGTQGCSLTHVHIPTHTAEHVHRRSCVHVRASADTCMHAHVRTHTHREVRQAQREERINT